MRFYHPQQLYTSFNSMLAVVLFYNHQLFPADLPMCASTGWCRLFHSCVSSAYTAAAGLHSLPWDQWYPITTHSSATAFQCLSPYFLISVFVFWVLIARPIQYNVFPVCQSKWKPKVFPLNWLIYGFFFFFFLRFLICLSLNNRGLCVLKCQGQLWHFSSLVRSWVIVFER